MLNKAPRGGGQKKHQPLNTLKQSKDFKWTQSEVAKYQENTALSESHDQVLGLIFFLFHALRWGHSS